MQQQDQSEIIDATEETQQTPAAPTAEEEEEQPLSIQAEDSAGEKLPGQSQRGGLDWLALSVALAFAAFFSLTARFNSQPAPSFIPAAVFSATGCGLLVTALHKLRNRPGVGLLEAGLAGLGMALFQFALTFTYPDVFTTATTAPEYGHAFLITWGLVGLFAVVLSLAGAAIGHLAFAPLRSLPERATRQNTAEGEADEEVGSAEMQNESSLPERRDTESADEEDAGGDADEKEGEEDTGEETDEEEDEDLQLAGAGERSRRPLVNYAITILLLGLLPMMAGYVFAATYDFVMNAMNVNQISPALYPTLSLLSGLLPWRLAAPINLASANGSFIVFTLLWRVPDSVLGNPNLLDVQALETLVFNGAALAFLLITMYGSDNSEKRGQAAPWGVFLSLEALLGLILVLPANLWLLRGLEGVLQIQNLVAALPTIQLINPAMFVLNLLTGVLFCVVVGLIVRRQHQLWTTPHKTTAEQSV